MKKIVSSIFITISMFFASFMLTSCNLFQNFKPQTQDDIYGLALHMGYEGSYDEWQELINKADGEDGRPIEVDIMGNDIVWRYVGNSNYRPIYSVNDLIGPKGDGGESAYNAYLANHPDYSKPIGEWLKDVKFGVVTSDVPLKLHTISFNTGCDDIFESIVVADFAKIEKPNDPIRENYSLESWYSGGVKWDFAHYRFTEDATLTAHWTENNLPLFTYRSDYSGGVIIDKYNGNDSRVVIPETINGLPVTELRSTLFEDCPNLETVVMNKNVVVYDSLFRKNPKLKNFYFNGTLKDYFDLGKSGKFAYFQGYENVNFYLKNSFNQYYLLEELYLTSDLGCLYLDMFTDIGSLKRIRVAKDFENIEELNYCNFDGCSNLQSIVVEKGNKLFDSRNNCNALIISSLNRLILGCSRTIIPDTVKTIGQFAFVNVRNLRNINIPASVSFIEDAAFSNIVDLERVTVDPKNPFYDSRDNCNAIINTSTNELVFGFKKTVIPNTVTSISSGYFLDRMVNEVNIPGNVKSIGEYALSICWNLNKVTLNEGLETIQGIHHSGIRELVIPSTVFEIGYINDVESLKVNSNSPYFYNSNDYSAIIRKGTNELIALAKNTGVIPHGVECISPEFKFPENIDTLRIPSSLTDFNVDIPSYIKHIYVDDRNPVYSSGKNDDCLISKKNNEVLHYCNNKDVIIDANYNSGVFDCMSVYHIQDMTSIYIPANITSIINIYDLPYFNMKNIYIDPNNPVYTSGKDSNCIIEKDTMSILYSCDGKIPEGVKVIDADFCYSDLGMDLVIPSTVTEILNPSSFYAIKSIKVASNNPNYMSDKDNCLLFDKKSNALLAGVSNYNSELTLPEGVKSFGDVTVPLGLKTLNLPSSFNDFSFFNELYADNNYLTTINIAPSNPYYASKNGNCIINKLTNELVYVIPNGRIINVAEGIQKIDLNILNLFTNPSLSYTLNLPSSINEIIFSDFIRRETLNNISVNPSNQTYKGDKNNKAIISKETNELLYILPNYEYVIVPEGVTTLDADKFNYLSTQALYLPSTLTEIINPQVLINQCDKIIVDPLNPVYEAINNGTTLVKKANKELVGFKYYDNGSRLKIPDGVEVLSADSFKYFMEAKNITQIELPESVKIIKANTFSTSVFRNLQTLFIKGNLDKAEANACNIPNLKVYFVGSDSNWESGAFHPTTQFYK